MPPASGAAGCLAALRMDTRGHKTHRPEESARKAPVSGQVTQETWQYCSTGSAGFWEVVYEWGKRIDEERGLEQSEEDRESCFLWIPTA